MEHNKRMSRRNVKHNYLLRGRMYCCGYSMIGECKRGILFYRCNHWHVNRFEKGKGCRRYIRCDVLDPIVWNYVLDIATDPDIFHDLLVKAQKAELDALQPKRERLAMVEGLIAQAETDAAKFARALVDASGGVVGDTLKKQVDDVNARHAALCAERDALTAEIEAGALTDEQIKRMQRMFTQNVITGLQNATFEDKQRALDDLQVVVYITDGNARVTCRIPTTDSVIALTQSLSRYNRRVMNRIARFEAMAEQLVEGTFARLFAGRLSPLEVVTHLARAVEDHQVLSPDGTLHAPTHYWVYLHPRDYEVLAVQQQELEVELARDVTELAAQADLMLIVAPSVHLLPDENVPPHQVRVDAHWMPEESVEGTEAEGTREMKARDGQIEGEGTPSGRPFLILNGDRHVNLFLPVVSLGRALDNTIILEDSRVSRHHAQLRRRYGRYVLYDLGSSGGTQINGYPVEECVLHSGDVISFAGVQVIYGEDPPTPTPLPKDGDTILLTQEVETG
jgi:hypothetical protein